MVFLRLLVFISLVASTVTADCGGRLDVNDVPAMNSPGFAGGSFGCTASKCEKTQDTN